MKIQLHIDNPRFKDLDKRHATIVRAANDGRWKVAILKDDGGVVKMHVKQQCMKRIFFALDLVEAQRIADNKLALPFIEMVKERCSAERIDALYDELAASPETDLKALDSVYWATHWALEHSVHADMYSSALHLAMRAQHPQPTRTECAAEALLDTVVDELYELTHEHPTEDTRFKSEFKKCLKSGEPYALPPLDGVFVPNLCRWFQTNRRNYRGRPVPDDPRSEGQRGFAKRTLNKLAAIADDEPSTLVDAYDRARAAQQATVGKRKCRE